MTLKLVIFDMDGVLVDACDWHKDALNEALKETYNYVISNEDHYGVFNGLPTKVKLNKLTEMGIVQAGQHEMINDLKQEKTIQIIKQQAQRDESKIELFKWLKEENIKVACFTNSIRKTATLMLEKAGVYDLLDCFVTNQDVEKPKPDPEGYLKVLKLFKCNPDNAIIVEDSPKGLKAAYATDCKVMKVANATEVHKENLRTFINENFNTYGWSRK